MPYNQQRSRFLLSRALAFALCVALSIYLSGPYIDIWGGVHRGNDGMQCHLERLTVKLRRCV